MTAPVALVGGSSNNFTTANVTRYAPACTGNLGIWTGASQATEARAQNSCPHNGTLANLILNIVTNARANATVFTVRKNAADTAVTVSTTASTTGEYSDTTHSATVAPTDTIDISGTTAGGSSNISTNLNSVRFTSSDGAASSSYGVFLSSATLSGTGPISDYMPFAGALAASTTETDAQSLVQAAGTAKYLQLSVSANTRSTTTTTKFRKNAGDGNQTVSFTSSQTGQLVDTTHTDSLSVNDLINVNAGLGTGTGNFSINALIVWIDATTDGQSQMMSLNLTGQALAAGATIYSAIAGQIPAGSGEGAVKGQLAMASTTSMLAVDVTVNASTTNATCKSRISSANGNQVATITALTTGSFQDTTHSDSPGTTTDQAVQYAGATTGSVTLNAVTMLMVTGATYAVSETESGTAADAPSSSATIVDSDAESVSASETPSSAGTLIGNDAESATAADTTDATSSSATSSVSESGSAADTPSSQAELVGTGTETGAAADAPGSLAVLGAAESESGTASETPDSIATLGASTSESGSASDAPTSIATFGTTASESGAAADTPTSQATLGGDQSESGSASDAPSATGNFGTAASESGSAADNPASAATLGASASDSASASEAPSSAGDLAASDDESGAAADTTDTQGSPHSDSTSESASASDAPASSATLPSASSDNVGATDDPASSGALAGHQGEATSVADNQSLTLTLAATAAESGAAADAASSSAVLVATEAESGTIVDFVTAGVEFDALVEEIADAQDTSEVSRILPIDPRYVITSARRIRAIPSARRRREISPWAPVRKIG